MPGHGHHAQIYQEHDRELKFPPEQWYAIRGAREVTSMSARRLTSASQGKFDADIYRTFLMQIGRRSKPDAAYISAPIIW